MKANGIFHTGLVLALCSSILVHAGETLTREAVNKLISGNTVEGVNVKWDKKMTWYFDSSGQIIKRDAHGNRGKASWKVEANGELCYLDKHRDREMCEPVISNADGSYTTMDGKWRWDKVLPGNPHGL